MLPDASRRDRPRGLRGGLLTPGRFTSPQSTPWNALCSRSGPGVQCSATSMSGSPPCSSFVRQPFVAHVNFLKSHLLAAVLLTTSFDSLCPPSFVWPRALDSPPSSHSFPSSLPYRELPVHSFRRLGGSFGLLGFPFKCLLVSTSQRIPFFDMRACSSD
ncbi:hypothetical protein EJ04DRAFT_183503 [Polyplosphaeria fusca]|uniref:Uncharacterized protein n=1 Tax=Polyplosphaeria fusca TaxID=682080 RepID=A0A9P4QY03_9PLEO|nr:hypothetical protein EJ04DRAFT_183503 [Polyplosphaeria fusca]